MKLGRGSGTVPLREHIERLLAEMDLRYQQRFDSQNTALDAARIAAKEAVGTALTAAEKAVSKAETATENRLTLLNELRSGVATQEQLSALGDRYADLKERLDRIEGRSGGLNAGWGYLVAAIATIVAVVSLYLAIRK